MGLQVIFIELFIAGVLVLVATVNSVLELLCLIYWLSLLLLLLLLNLLRVIFLLSISRIIIIFILLLL